MYSVTSLSCRLLINRCLLLVFSLDALDVCQCLLPNVLPNLPSAKDMSLRENVLNLFEGATNCLGVHEEYVDEDAEVEGAKDEIGLPCNRCEARWDSVGKCKVEEPVRCRRKRYGLSTNFERELLLH